MPQEKDSAAKSAEAPEPRALACEVCGALISEAAADCAARLFPEDHRVMCQQCAAILSLVYEDR